MDIATIVPIAHLDLERNSDYHLCLAHIADHNAAYFSFYRRQSLMAHFVILDNGAAENGQSMNIEDLMSIAISIRCREMVLPDVICDRASTLKRSREALDLINEAGIEVMKMVVPQGNTAKEWISCVREMLEWNVNTFGISKFITQKLFGSRVEALEAVPELIDSKMAIHLLGYTGDGKEVSNIRNRFRGRIRGIDSSIATLYAQRGEVMPLSGRPEGEALNLDAIVDEKLLERNIEKWRMICQ